MWPNRDFLSQDAVFEKRAPRAKVSDMHLKTARKKKLHQYLGKIKGVPNSRVAISTKNGMTGYILLHGHRYYIEPAKNHMANKRGQLLHVVYEEDNVAKKENQCGTSSDWKSAWKKRFWNQMENEQNSYEQEDAPEIETRGLHSVHRYLETLVVVDKQFIEYHKHQDVEAYILTIMNMVSDFYHDDSVGNQMDVVVVRIIYLEKEEEEIDLMINPRAEDTLKSFCKWQQTVNPPEDHHPHHHDIAVLLTRYDICSDNMTNCGLMGLANMASACTGDKPCAINEDGGLILGIVVAHEIGHVMGSGHDAEEDSQCKAQAEDESYFVMSPIVHMHTVNWSPCSRAFITKFFNSDLGECLNEEPIIMLNKESEMPPGAMYDATYQCQYWFPGSVVCLQANNFCKMLMCRTSPLKCSSKGEPPADGTKCGENKWCYQKKCVEIGERPAAINGGWGEWGQWSDCSRSCGSGVSYSERECNNPVPKHKGRYCLGERRKVKTCNTIPCPEGSKPFRAVQCSKYDKKPFQQKLHKWVPYFKEDVPCALYCVNKQNIFTKLSPVVEDGTPCRAGSKDICVLGACLKVGCDDVINSNAVLDQCGICKGDGTQCKLVEETFKDQPGNSYVKIATIFKGVRMITVEELAPSQNSIAVSDADGKTFFLNGNHQEEGDGSKDIGGVVGLYSHPEPEKEMLTIAGPLTKDIVLYVVFYAKENVGYTYKYAEPSAEATYQPHYHWEFVEWGECSVRCGGGSQMLESACLEEKAGKVTPTFCDQAERPEPRSRKCHEEPCKIKWRVGKWGPCQACRFKAGVQIREVECVRESHVPGDEDVLIDDEECAEPKPASRQLCHSNAKCPKRKRDADYEGLKPRMLRKLWFQMFSDFTDYPAEWFKHTSTQRGTRQVLRAIRNFKNKRGCLEEEEDKSAVDAKESMPNVTLKIGAVAIDKIPSNEIKLIEVPLKQSHLCLNLSDNAFETVGDNAGDTMDFKHKNVLTGEAAAKKMKKLQHVNVTKEKYED